MGSGMEKVKMSWLACLLLLVARGVVGGRDLEEKWEVDEGEGDGIGLGGPGEGFGGPGFGGGIGGPGTGDGGGYGGDCRGGGGDGGNGGNGYGGGDGGTDGFGWPGTGDGGYGGHNYNEVMHQMKFDHQGKAGAAAALNNESP